MRLTMERRKHWSQWIMAALGMLWLGLFPLWQDGSYSRITRSKWIGMLVLTFATAAVCAHMLAALWKRRELRRQVRLNWLHAAALAYFALVGLSAVFGSWADCNNESGQLTVLFGAKRYEGLITQACYGVIFLCMSLVQAGVRRVLDAAAWALLAFCGVVALQYADVNVLELFPVGTSLYTNYEFQGTIGNIDMVVGYLAIAMPALLGGFAMLDKPGALWLPAGMAGFLLLLMMEVQCGLIMAAAMLFGLALAALRFPACRWRVMVILGGALMLLSVRLLTGLPWLEDTDEVLFFYGFAVWKLLPALAGAAVLAGGYFLKKRPLPAMQRRWVLAAACAAVALVLLAVYVLPLPQGSGLWEMQELLHGRAKDAYGSERIGVWRLTLEMSRQNLLWGTGPDTFLYAMEDHLWRTEQELVQRFDNPHNLLLGVLSNSGLPAMLMFLVLCGGAIIAGVCRLERDRALLPLILAALCYLVQGMFTFSICLVTPMFWAALGMLAAHGIPREMERKDDKDNEHDPKLCVPAQGDGRDPADDVGVDRGGAAGGAAGADPQHGDARNEG